MSGGGLAGGSSTNSNSSQQTQSDEQLDQNTRSALFQSGASRTGQLQDTSLTNINATQSVLPDYITGASQAVLGLGALAASQPYTPYRGARVAGFNDDDTASFDLVRNAEGVWEPSFDTATDVARSSAAFAPADVSTRLWDAGALAQYSSPYTNAVVDSSLALYDEGAAKRRNQQQMEIARTGAFGGGRHGVAEAEYDRGTALDRTNLSAGLRDQSFRTALGAFTSDEARRLAANQGNQQAGLANEARRLEASRALADYGTRRSALSYGDAEARSGIGALRRGQQQQVYDVAHQDYLEQRDWPVRQLNILKSALAGIPAPVSTVSGGYQVGNTRSIADQISDQIINEISNTARTTTGSSSSTGSQDSTTRQSPNVLGLAGGALSLALSDARAKEGIRQVGGLPDGTGLYSFRYRGGGEPMVGVVAQDLLLRPKTAKAVYRDPDGTLMVDYRALGLKMATLAEWNAKGVGAVKPVHGALAR